MHDNNHKWLRDLQKAYPQAFHDVAVLEIGSKIWGVPPNDTVRPYFTDCYYVGVDREDGPGVDVVSEVSNLTFVPESFDVLVSFSLFEHDPAWRSTLKSALRFLCPGGLLFTCFGAEGNLPHLMRWAIVPHRQFLLECVANDLTVLDHFFEEDRYGKDCAGCYNVVAMKRAAL